jgi:hypothetical protein
MQQAASNHHPSFLFIPSLEKKILAKPGKNSELESAGEEVF